MKTVFLDRDGVINVERGEYTWRIKDFEFVNGLFDALRELQERGFAFIVITNQGGIAKGLYKHEDVNSAHKFMRDEFKKEGIEILDIFYSPYHDQFSESLSRKPDSLMLERAVALYNIDPSQSYMIGDSERDIVAANKIGIQGIKVDSNQNLSTILNRIGV